MQIAKLQTFKVASTRGNAVRVKPFVQGKPAGRNLSVQVFAKKGLGAKRGPQMRQVSGGAPTMAEPPVPEVDPVNAEFVVFIRARNYNEGKIQIAEGPWFPLSIFRGTNALNFLVKALESEWGRKLYGKLLISQIATGLYKEREGIEKKIRQQIPPFANVPSKNFQYAFKLRDKSNPKDWKNAEGVTIIPPESELVSGLDNVKNFFTAENFSNLFKSS